MWVLYFTVFLVQSELFLMGFNINKPAIKDVERCWTLIRSNLLEAFGVFEGKVIHINKPFFKAMYLHCRGSEVHNQLLMDLWSCKNLIDKILYDKDVAKWIRRNQGCYTGIHTLVGSLFSCIFCWMQIISFPYAFFFFFPHKLTEENNYGNMLEKEIRDIEAHVASMCCWILDLSTLLTEQ